jgi:hypothetical protein
MSVEEKGMKSRIVIVAVAALALAIGLPGAAHAACAAGQIDLSINNISPAVVDVCFTISGNTLTFNSISGTPASGGSFVRFDEISVNGTETSLASFSSGAQTWTFNNTKCDGPYDGLGGTYTAGICGSTAGNPTTPSGSTWTFAGGTLSGPVTAHVIFSTGCTFFAASSGTSNSGGVSGNCVAGSPEPGTLVMFGTGLLGLAGIVRRKLIS